MERFWIDLIFWVLVSWVGTTLILNLISYQTKTETKMSKNNAILVVPLADIDYSKTIYYVGEVYNPESILKTPKDFSDFIFHSNVYETQSKAVLHAHESNESRDTTHGILVFDEWQQYTFGDVIIKKFGGIYAA